MFEGVRTVMVFAVDPEASARWYGELFGVPVRVDVADTGAVYAWVETGGVELGFHPADDARNPRGGSPVVYWRVADVHAVRERLLAAGCAHHRGPLVIEPGRRVAQLRDPFGTIIGIDGP
ncbi:MULTISPECIES: VOC family protein [unclassified Streptomyces]|uniref:VOC family protein n=1 Tax=unclassified Streptomyces TaxID=2593676 RepID=UPI002E7606DF|nr:VOC family protein [Streptomyces sp. JV184]MEE1747573.1 VOC family protein [Streptomyces sp. JV184]